jgi:hypothetical protein
MSNGRNFPIRSFVGSVVLVAVAAASVYLSFELVVKPRRALQDQIREQKGTILKLEQEKQRLEAYLKILKHINRRARVEVLRQATDQQGSLQTTIRFTEVDDAGKPINVSRELTLPGQEVYFDTLVMKFDDHFIEQGDPVKGGALMVFRRIFSSTMRAEDGFVIDTEGQVPEVYAERQATSEFEKDLWKRFWDLANDEKLARERRRAGYPRRRALHASGARPSVRNLPEVNRRSHHHTRNAHGAAANETRMIGDNHSSTRGGATRCDASGGVLLVLAGSLVVLVTDGVRVSVGCASSPIAARRHGRATRWAAAMGPRPRGVQPRGGAARCAGAPASWWTASRSRAAAGGRSRRAPGAAHDDARHRGAW